MNKGSIIYLGAELPDKDAASHRVINNAKIFKELGYNVVLLGMDRSLHGTPSIEETKSVVQGFDSYIMPYPDTYVKWVQYLCENKYITDVCDLVGDVKYIVLYNHPAISMYKTIKYGKTHNIKILGDTTEWYSARNSGIFYFFVKGIDTFCRMHLLNKRLDGLIVISEFLNTYYRRCKHIVCIPPLTDKNEKKWERDKCKKHDEGCIQLIYAGNPGHKDELGELIQGVMIATRDCHLSIYGISKEEWLERQSSKKNTSGSEKRVSFYGKVSHSEVIAHLKASDFSCFFRKKSRVSQAGFPTKLAESITCSVPVITNSSSNISDYFKNGMNGYIVDELSSSAIASVIDAASCDIKVQDTLFDYHSFINKMRDFFNELY